MIEWTYFEKRDGPSPGTRGPENPNLDSSDITTGKQELVLCNMEDIITVMVPLAAASPVISANLNSFRNMVALTGDVDDIVRPYAESTFGAFFRMFTNEFDSTTRRLDVLRLSQAVQSGLFSRSSLIGGTESKSTPTNDQNMVSSRDIQHELNAKQLRQLTAEMDEWVYDESSVIVNCGFYVWSVIITAITLVIGGLAIGFALGTRIEGVDPFNITTYAWVLAAFVILVCKSIYVENWPWRDFLLRRVQCRSVSELQGITGINEQLIMAKLLHDEHWTILNTRGPYNSVFQRKSQDGTGFSIDRPLNTRTLLLSGLTLLKVITPEGHALVCLDARRGTDLKVVEHRGLASKEHLVCEIIRPQLRTSEESRGIQPLKLSLTKSPLRSQSPLRWKGVQGVYNKLDTVFV